LRQLVAIVGPTGSGKTDLAIAIASAIGGEIVNADSRQLYRGMAIGTAQPSKAQLVAAPHHLFAITDPDKPLNVSEYHALAEEAIGESAGRGRLPILAGGSGLYVRAVVEGLVPPRVAPDVKLREKLERQLSEEGPDRLYAEVEAKDPAAAKSIDPRNYRRLIRALEVIRTTGMPFSQQGHIAAPARETVKLGLTMDRESLFRRVDARVDAMVAGGLIEETRALLAAGHDEPLPAMTSVGYREIAAFLRGEMSMDAAVEKMKQRTHRFIRQQYTWFRLDDPEIRWFEGDDPATTEQAVKLVQDWRH
jgi:tRNA dimethylallyltransferase